MNDAFDVVIVGAGPAGAIAAYHLARSGRRVLILERERLPRYKPCGGGVTAKALRELPFPIDAIVEREVCDADIWFGADRVIHVRGEQIGKMVMRAAFDEHIVRRALEAGAELRDGLRVLGVRSSDAHMSVETDAGVVGARCVIGADGANSVVRKTAGLGGHGAWGVAIEAEIDVADEVADSQTVVFDFRAVPSGYAYVFPKARHLSVGVYTMLPALQGLRAHLDAYVSGNAALRGGRVRSIVGHRVPLGRVSGPLQQRGVLLAGDAAGLGEPLWGEGIYYALTSGRIAAETIGAALQAENYGLPDLARYDARIRRELAADLRFAGTFARVFHRFPRGRAASLARDPALAAGMMGILRGECSYRRFMLMVLRRLPALLVKKLTTRS